jgi:hypothetical protein
MNGDSTNKGFLDNALDIATKLNAFLPLGIGLGVQVIALIKQARAAGKITPEQEARARQAIADFEAVSKEVSDFSTNWLRDNPPTP